MQIGGLFITKRNDQTPQLTGDIRINIITGTYRGVSFQVCLMVRILVKVLGCDGISCLILIAIHGIEDNAVLMRFTDVLIAKSYHALGRTCIRNALILKNTSFQLIFETVGVVKLAW